MRRVMLHHESLGIRKLRAQGEMNLLRERAHQGNPVHVGRREPSHFERVGNGGLRQSPGRKLAGDLAFFDSRHQLAIL